MARVQNNVRELVRVQQELKCISKKCAHVLEYIMVSAAQGREMHNTTTSHTKL